MEKEQRLNVLKEILTKEFQITSFDPDYTLKNDYGLDSLDVVEFIMECEKAFTIFVPDEEMDLFHDFTLDQVVEYIDSKK